MTKKIDFAVTKQNYLPMDMPAPKEQIRRLSVSDLPLIKDLLQHQHRFFQMAKNKEMNAQFIEALKHRLLNDTEHTSLHLYGAFFDEQLAAIAGGFFGVKMPLWSLTYMHARQDAHIHFRKTTGKIIDTLIDHAEANGIYRFDYATALRSILTYNEANFPSRLVKISEKAKRYQYYTDALIPKNTKPQYEYHWFLMGQRTHDIDILIRVGELKEEYRTEVTQKIKSSERNKFQRVLELEY